MVDSWSPAWLHCSLPCSSVCEDRYQACFWQQLYFMLYLVKFVGAHLLSDFIIMSLILQELNTTESISKNVYVVFQLGKDKVRYFLLETNQLFNLSPAS